MEQTPPIDFQGQNNNVGGDFNQQNVEQTPMMGNNEMGMETNNFDTNFDPGVEANEEEDPKKFIQQLTGKLSQSLRKYNEDNGQPDVDLNKYVTGMIAKQSMEGLSQDDADEIIKKIKADEDFSMENGNDGQEQQQGDNQPTDNQISDNNENQIQQPNESTVKKGNRIEEIVNGVLKNDEEDKEPYQKTDGKKSFRKKPFTSPNFEN